MKDQSHPKKLTRSRSDRYIGGVAAGLAERIGIDPIFVRIAFVASLAFGGLGLLAYIGLLIAVPIDGDPSEPLPPLQPRRRNMMIGLAVFVGFVGIVTADAGSTAAWLFGFWPGTVFGVLFWVAAAAAAIWLLATDSFALSRSRGDGAGSPVPASPPPPSSAAEDEPETDAEPSTEIVTYADSPTQLSRTEVMETRAMPFTAAADDPGEDGEPGSPAEAAATRRQVPSKIGRAMTWFAIGLTGLIVFCLLFVFSAGVTAAFGGVPMAALVIVLGAGMVFAGLRGRRQLSGWLLAAAVAVTLPMAAVSIADLRVEGPYGEIKKAPMSVLDVPDGGYEMAAGNMTIDLRRFEFDRHRETPLEVESGMGLTSIVVPDDVCVTGSVEGKAGVVTIRGEQTNGFDVHQRGLRPASPKLAARGGILALEGEFKLGAFEVVDNTQWRENGRGGSFEEHSEAGHGSSEAARERARRACAAPAVERAAGGAKEARS